MKALQCRMCHGTKLTQWLDLGHQPHSDQFHKTNEEPEVTYPLGVSVCEDCGLNQLTYIVAKEELYLKDYLYESSITKTADAHWTEFAETVTKKIALAPGSLVIDIGSNDGTLLTKFQAQGMKVLGIDPTPEATQIAIDRGVPTIQEFFNSQMVHKHFAAGDLIKRNLVIGANVFAHVHDLDDFMLGVWSLIGNDGVFVFESPYFGEFLKGLEYDTVYHQHLSYLSLKPIVKFLERHDMEVFDVEQHELHGGGFRVYMARKGNMKVQDTVPAMLANETWTLDDLKKFAEDAKKNRATLCELIERAHRQGKTIAVVSTPAKGNTLLNYTGLGRYIDFATDKSKLKQGRYTPGTFIKVYSDEELIKRQPDFALVLAWNFFDEIVKNNPEYKGAWIRPLPDVKIV